MSSSEADTETLWITAEPWPTPDGICQVCKKRPATESVFGIPGSITFWCRRCILESSIKSAREAVAELPKLEAELAELDKKDE